MESEFVVWNDRDVVNRIIAAVATDDTRLQTIIVIVSLTDVVLDVVVSPFYVVYFYVYDSCD